MTMDEASEHLIKTGTVAKSRLNRKPLRSHRYDSELSNFKQQHHIDPAFRQRQWLYRFFPLIIIFVATVISVVLGYLRYQSYTTTGELFVLVQSNRGTVQVVVQIISQALGALSVLSISAVLNYQSRSSLYNEEFSLNSLRLWAAFSRASIDWNLPVLPRAGTIAFRLLTIVPAAIWTGALTPQSTGQIQNAELAIPTVGNGSYTYLYPSKDHGKCWITQQLNGTFTDCPTLRFTGKLLDSASSATTPDGSARNHSKLDNARFRYTGRSYGVGTPVGLTDSKLLDISNIDKYSYTETGYTTTAKCIYNTSSLWYISPSVENNTVGRPNIFYAIGWFPNSEYVPEDPLSYSEIPAPGQDFYVQMDLKSTGPNIVSIGSHNSDKVSRYFIAIAAGSNYPELNKIQCELFFQPTRFAVNVFKATSTITVTPLNSTAPPDPEPRGVLRSQVLNGLNAISTVSTSLYTSNIGDALAQNINNLMARQSSTMTLTSADPAHASNDTILTAVSESVSAIADDLLMSFAGAALTIPNQTSTTTAIAEYAVVAIGSTLYIAAIAIINVVLLLIVTAITLRSRFWQDLPIFDYTDLGCLSAGLAAEPSRSASKQSMLARRLKHWNGNPGDEVVGRMAVQLMVEPETKQLSVSLS